MGSQTERERDSSTKDQSQETAKTIYTNPCITCNQCFLNPSTLRNYNSYVTGITTAAGAGAISEIRVRK